MSARPVPANFRSACILHYVLLQIHGQAAGDYPTGQSMGWLQLVTVACKRHSIVAIDKVAWRDTKYGTNWR